MEKLIDDQRKLLSWHLKNSGVTVNPEFIVGPGHHKSLTFEPQLIDHTLLKPQATSTDIETYCAEAITHGFAGVCVSGSYLPLVRNCLQGTSIKPICVVGFPLGTASSQNKMYETELAVAQGAQEIDMVLHVGHLKAKHLDYVFRDIEEVVKAARCPVKVILETCLLNDIEKIQACFISQWAGAAFVKTSTGFSEKGATVADVALMRKVVAPHMGVKASGGIKTYADVENMLRAGASRIGTSSGSAIMKERESGDVATPTSELY